MENENNQGIGNTLATMAKLKKISQRDLADRIGVSRVSINRFFNSHTNLRADDFSKLCLVLGVDIQKQIADELAKLIGR